MSTVAPGVSATTSRASRSTSASLSGERRRHEVPDQHLHPRAIDRGLELIRVHEPFVARRSFPATCRSVGRRSMKRRRQPDRVDHPPLRVSGMGVEAAEGHGHRVRREALVFELAAAAAVERVGADGAEPCDVEVIGAAADLLVRRERRSGSGPCGISGWRIRYSAAVTISATPALSSAPSSVRPDAVTMSLPMLRGQRPGFSLAAGPPTGRRAARGRGRRRRRWTSGRTSVPGHLRRRVHVRDEADDRHVARHAVAGTVAIR